jgi:hypothetical protein
MAAGFIGGFGRAAERRFRGFGRAEFRPQEAPGNVSPNPIAASRPHTRRDKVHPSFFTRIAQVQIPSGTPNFAPLSSRHVQSKLSAACTTRGTHEI